MGNSSSNLSELVAVLVGEVYGVVLFRMINGYVEISYDIKDLKPNTSHGFHIHESGDLRDGCSSLCAHYNPYNLEHGGLNDEITHAGDLGNIRVDKNGKCSGIILTRKFCLHEILGRSIIVHEDEDDEGKTSHNDSKTTGNSGKRIACGVIGRSKNCS
jgi:Cu-Zn family superoxide dismutase